jgi:hypothetical protein
LKLKRNLGCPPSSHVIVGRERQNVAPNKVEGILSILFGKEKVHEVLPSFIVLRYLLPTSPCIDVAFLLS